MVPTVSVGDPRSGCWCVRYLGGRFSSAATRNPDIFVIALMPKCGLELWAARPCERTLHRKTPLEATTVSRPVGSATTAPSALMLDSKYLTMPRNACSSSTPATNAADAPGGTP